MEKVTAETVARCESCFAYINCHAKFVRDGWWCPLCHNTNVLPSRYAGRTRKFLPELQEGLLEFDVSGTGSLALPCEHSLFYIFGVACGVWRVRVRITRTDDHLSLSLHLLNPIDDDACPTQPVFIAVVDLTGARNLPFVELAVARVQRCTCTTKSSVANPRCTRRHGGSARNDQDRPCGSHSRLAAHLLTLLFNGMSLRVVHVLTVTVVLVRTALPPSSLFGLVTFSDRIGVYDLRSPIPHIKHIAIPESGDCSLGLEELVPLSNSLVEVPLCHAIFRSLPTPCPLRSYARAASRVSLPPSQSMCAEP